jgi:hypothetical protein
MLRVWEAVCWIKAMGYGFLGLMGFSFCVEVDVIEIAVVRV